MGLMIASAPGKWGQFFLMVVVVVVVVMAVANIAHDLRSFRQEPSQY
jgi:ABC-type phosphate/phosphonate transport system permease subunit